MPIPTHVNNILGIAISNISSTGSLNFGNDILKGFMANAQSSGGQVIIGTGVNRPVTSFQLSAAYTPNVVSQGQSQV